MRKLIGIALTMLLLAGGQIFGFEMYIGPSDIDGHIYKTPPTEAEMQKMLDERVERHACMQKSVALSEKYNAARNPLLVAYPTSNMYKYDVLHYKIDIAIDMASETIDGYVDILCKSLVDGLSSVDLTLTTSLNVTDARLNGSSKTYSHSTDILTVNFDQTFNTDDEFTVRIYYNGSPVYSNLDGMEFYTIWSRKVCYTNCEPFGARNWWPCKDFPFDKADNGADIIITHPTTYGGYSMDVVSNGLLQSVTNNGATTTTYWKESHPISTYLIALVLTDFNQTVQNWEYEPGQFMPVEQNYYPSAPPSATWSSTYYMVNYTIPALDALSHYFGRYPFWDEKYGHMHYGWGGAMEHQTSTSISPYFNSEYVIAHELMHQWSGDNVTCKTFNHMWLNEGFASYGEVLYFEYTYGWPTAKSWLMGQHHINAGTPYVEDIETDDMFDGATVYDKGSWLVHMLRNQMGDSLFFPAMQDYFLTSQFAGKSANTDDLNSICSQYFGSDMSWFFDAWVYQEDQPNYEYSYEYEASAKSADYLVHFYLAQNNTDGIFPMYVDIVAFAGGYDTTFTIWDGSEGELINFNLPNPPDSFWIDPDDKILKTVTEVPWTMHIAVSQVPDAVIGQPYSFTFSAIGGVPDYSWEKTLGQYPVGLTFNTSTGELSGTPTWVADYYFQLLCTDSDDPPNTDERGFLMRVVEQSIPRGDVDDSGNIDIDDVVYLINYIFGGGPAPDPIEKGDVDCSDNVDIDDVVYLINYIFGGGPAPCE